jgi:oxaloacetate decarboxylase gamma subunit
MMSNQLAEAGVLMGVGMTVVFAFLILLIGGIHSIAWIANLFPQPEVMTHKNSKPKYNKITSSPTTVDPKIVKAITAAVNTHRRATASK